jgi:hypothetical protein
MVLFVEEAEWERLIDQLHHGDCTPFLGAGASHGALPSGSGLSKQWATEFRYPFPDDDDLARVMQYAAVTALDAVWIKQRLCRDLGAKSAPDFTSPTEPHALLAEFPLSVFLTTNYDDFLVGALRHAGKKPRAAVCPWYEGAPYDRELFESTLGLDPQPDHPLVYHLHGNLATPQSLVLTENDYLEFLVSSAAEPIEQNRTLVPAAILTALTTRPLLFIGYSLQDWTFRVLFHGLIRAIPDIHRRRHVSVQLPTPVNGSIDDARNRAQQFLTRYLGSWNISIFWGTAAEFCAQLRSRMGAMA